MKHVKMFEYFIDTDKITVGQYALIEYTGNPQNPKNDEIVEFVNNNIGVVVDIQGFSKKNEYFIVKYDVPEDLKDSFTKDTVVIKADKVVYASNDKEFVELRLK